jgi:hypothetical protein
MGCLPRVYTEAKGLFANPSASLRSMNWTSACCWRFRRQAPTRFVFVLSNLTWPCPNPAPA